MFSMHNSLSQMLIESSKSFIDLSIKGASQGMPRCSFTGMASTKIHLLLEKFDPRLIWRKDLDLNS